MATVSSGRRLSRDRSTVWIGAAKSSWTVVGPSNRPDSEPRTMLPSASAAGRIISRSSPVLLPGTRSSRAISGSGSRSRFHTCGMVGLARRAPQFAWPAASPGPPVGGPEAW